VADQRGPLQGHKTWQVAEVRVLAANAARKAKMCRRGPSEPWARGVGCGAQRCVWARFLAHMRVEMGLCDGHPPRSPGSDGAALDVRGGAAQRYFGAAQLRMRLKNRNRLRCQRVTCGNFSKKSGRQVTACRGCLDIGSPGI